MKVEPGSVRTLTGNVDPDALGPTLPHEHLFIDLTEAWFDRPESAVDRRLAREPVSIEHLHRIRRDPLNNRDNGRLESVDTAIDELEAFHRRGGEAVVDVTPKHLGGDPERVRQVGQALGLDIVHGTAFYTHHAHPDRVGRIDVDEIADEFVDDVCDGIGTTDCRAGIVGEIGLSGRIHEDEERVLRAGARAARRTGAPLSIHPPGRRPEAHQGGTHPSSRWALDALDIVEEEGLAPERVVVSHMDRTRLEFDPDSLDYQRAVADRGAYLEYDLWGTDYYQETFGNGWPSDRERLDAVVDLIDDGYADRLLFSQDICMKVQRTAYGGHGYGHTLDAVVPMLLDRGVGPETTTTITERNPGRLLSFDTPE